MHVYSWFPSYNYMPILVIYHVPYIPTPITYAYMPIRQMAADLRLTHALFNLGMMHTAGDGVAQVYSVYVYVYIYSVYK